jgi:hypothetical protein
VNETQPGEAGAWPGWVVVFELLMWRVYGLNQIAALSVLMWRRNPDTATFVTSTASRAARQARTNSAGEAVSAFLA